MAKSGFFRMYTRLRLPTDEDGRCLRPRSVRSRIFAVQVTTAVAALALVASSGVLAQQPHRTHWEPYKNAASRPSVNRNLEDPVLIGAIDLHVHHGPDSYPRQWDAFEIAELAKARGMRAIVLKNHWTETAGLAYLIRKYGAQGIEVFGSVTLDSPVGGVNPQAVRYMVDVTGGYGRIVWLPTHDSEHEVAFNEDQRPSAAVSRDGKLLPEVLEVLDLVKEHDLTLATGHVTPAETLEILRAARERGITRLIVTHPLLHPQFTFMSIAELREAAELGASIEITANSLFRAGEGRQRVLDALRAIGSEHFFVSSDSGLIGTPNHPDALAMAAQVLRDNGFDEQALNSMFKHTPARLLGLPPL
jgi:hypothetical protein